MKPIFLLACLVATAPLYGGWLIISDGILVIHGRISVKDGELDLDCNVNSTGSWAIIKVPTKNQDDITIFAEEMLRLGDAQIETSGELRKAARAANNVTLVEIENTLIPAVRGDFGPASFLHGKPFDVEFLSRRLRLESQGLFESVILNDE
ncbi:MAG TPA: hypothetical protein VEL47_01665 [Myxococcota bacterium]|nr:hypothetical protein [Myxococcota bacterium]